MQCWEWKNDELEKDKSTFDLQIDVFTDRTIDFLCQFCFRSPIVEMFKLSLTSLCFNALLSNSAPSCVMLFPAKLSIVHCFCSSASSMTPGISFKVKFLHEYEISTGWMIGVGCIDDVVTFSVTMVAEGMLTVNVEIGWFDDGKGGRLGNVGWISLRWIIVNWFPIYADETTSNSRPGKRRISSSSG